MSELSIAGYILTGGKNSRMDGRTKFFLEYEGHSFGEYIMEALSPLPTVYLSVNPETKDEYEALGIPLIADEYDSIGPLGGIVSGLHQVETEALFVAASDMPFLKKETVDLLLHAYSNRKALTLAGAEGITQPLLGIYPKSVLRTAEALIEEKNYRLRDLVKRIKGAQIVTLMPEDTSVKNINTVQEFQRLGLVQEVLKFHRK